MRYIMESWSSSKLENLIPNTKDMFIADERGVHVRFPETFCSYYIDEGDIFYLSNINGVVDLVNVPRKDSAVVAMTKDIFDILDPLEVLVDYSKSVDAKDCVDIIKVRLFKKNNCNVPDGMYVVIKFVD